jgi:pyridoxal 5'-phosphate synthase pdxT subunit
LPEKKSHDAVAKPRIGVLAIQGDYAAHADALRDSGAEPVLVRKPEELAGPDANLDGLIIPGGESTTFLKFLERDGFLESLRSFAISTPTFGTCAGCILLATNVLHPPQASLGVLDATVERNAYGRQIDSSIEETPTRLGTSFDTGPLETVYIRAPRIQSVGKDVTVLAERDGFPVLVRQGHLLAATFHPELSTDRRVHRYFVEMVREANESASHSAPQSAHRPRQKS